MPKTTPTTLQPQPKMSLPQNLYEKPYKGYLQVNDKDYRLLRRQVTANTVDKDKEHFLIYSITKTKETKIVRFTFITNKGTLIELIPVSWVRENKIKGDRNEPSNR